MKSSLKAPDLFYHHIKHSSPTVIISSGRVGGARRNETRDHVYIQVPVTSPQRPPTEGVELSDHPL